MGSSPGHVTILLVALALCGFVSEVTAKPGGNKASGNPNTNTDTQTNTDSGSSDAGTADQTTANGCEPAPKAEEGCDPGDKNMQEKTMAELSYTPTFLRREYDSALDRSCFGYQVVVAPGDDEIKDISHITFGVEKCTGAMIMGTTPETKNDPTTCVKGAKLDKSQSKGSSKEYWVCLYGDIPTGQVTIAIKGGKLFAKAAIQGPNCVCKPEAAAANQGTTPGSKQGTTPGSKQATTPESKQATTPGSNVANANQQVTTGASTVNNANVGQVTTVEKDAQAAAVTTPSGGRGDKVTAVAPTEAVTESKDDSLCPDDEVGEKPGDPNFVTVEQNQNPAPK